jgi:threonylcarbamoyladenosine tRNA methylthiotransferase MtaB
VPAGEVVAQARRLVEAGYAEIVLTGVDITSYGLDLPGRMRLGGLVRHILRHVPELKRLRLSSIDQVEADRDLIDAFAEEPRLMPHLHLSLQAGDDMILKRMKRRHTRADAVAFCAEVRRLRPDVAFGADLIAGFPTETEAMFAGSLQIVDDCGLAFLHVFPFSARPGTPAARMPRVAGNIVKERAARLRQKGRLGLAAYLESQVGRRIEVLMEQPGLGRTASFAEIEIAPKLTEACAPAAGALVNVCVTGTDGSRLRGEPHTPKCAP